MSKFDVVLTTVSPNSTAIIGYFLKKLSTANWVIDYRDPWIPNPFRKRGRIRYFLENKIENSMLSSSDFNVTTSSFITEIYRQSYPQHAEKFRTITNCYDPELQFVSPVREVEIKPNRKFRIIHAGTFYAKRNPTGFLEGLVALIAKHPEIRSKIEMLFIGVDANAYKKQILSVSRKLSVDCEIGGTVSYKESMQCICSSDLLLAINGIEDRDNIFIPAKIFDYMAANKPILLIGHKGAASEIVERGQLGAVRKHDDIDGICEAIYDLYSQWERSLPFEPDEQYIARYHASNVTKQLVAVLDELVRS
jgi:glycosyltransferase involved in cell wall biosynthesis